MVLPAIGAVASAAARALPTLAKVGGSAAKAAPKAIEAGKGAGTASKGVLSPAQLGAAEKAVVSRGGGAVQTATKGKNGVYDITGKGAPKDGGGLLNAGKKALNSPFARGAQAATTVHQLTGGGKQAEGAANPVGPRSAMPERANTGAF